MTKLDGTAEEDERRLGRGRYSRNGMAPGRWVNPLLGILGALVLSGHLMTGYPSAPAATAPATPSDEQLASEQVPPQLAFNEATSSLPHSSVATFSSMPDLLKAAFAAALALAWAVGCAWFGMPRARRPNPVHGPAAYPMHISSQSERSPTCERMYDETRLVPQYLRSAKFPAAKHDLVRLARVYPNEGSALHRLECIPDRRYSSLHDLLTEIRVD